MSSELPRLELERVLQSEAAEMVAAREKALLIHRTRDIDAAGDEVEKAARAVIRRKLPTAYYVGHGHITDARLVTSPQLDLIIADNAAAPILFSTENGTEYFPYESIYAVGEIKSTYYKDKNYVHSFVDILERLRSELQREQTPPTYIAPGIEIGPNLIVEEAPPYRNPLFSFMLFVNSGAFTTAHIEDLYASTPDPALPSLLCFLDKGIVVNARVPDSAEGTTSLGPINLRPEFNSEHPGESNRWVWIPFGKEENRIGVNFGFLFFALVQHLRSTILRPPDLLEYLNRFFAYEGGQTIT